MGNNRYRLADGEILAFRVEMTFKKYESTPTYNVVVKHQGNEGRARRIENATKDVESGQNRNNDIADVYKSIKEYYVGRFNNISSPVFAFVHMVRQCIDSDKIRLQNIVNSLWEALQPALDPYDSDAVARLLRSVESNFFAPLLEGMRERVRANIDELWTADTIERLRLNPGGPFQCYVRYYFCDCIMRDYLRDATDLYETAVNIAEKRDNLKPRLTKIGSKKTKKKNQNALKLGAMLDIINTNKSSMVTKEINAYTGEVEKIVTTYKRGGQGGNPLTEPELMRSSTGYAKEAAIEATLSLRVLPATAPHFHLCLNSQYFRQCFKNNTNPKVVEAVKISHVRRYRAENLRTERAKVYRTSDLPEKEEAVEMARKTSSSKESVSAKIFDEARAAFLENHVYSKNPIGKRKSRLQKRYDTIKNELKEHGQMIFGKPAERPAQVDDAAAAAPQKISESQSRLGDAGGETERPGAASSGEEQIELIGLDDLVLGDDAVSEDVKKMVEYKQLQKLKERIERGENKLIKFKDRPNKNDKFLKNLNKKKAKFLKKKAELKEILRKLNESSEE